MENDNEFDLKTIKKEGKNLTEEERKLNNEILYRRRKKKKDIFTLADCYMKKKADKNKPHNCDTKFKKGNNVGVRFGHGQSRGKNGPKRKPESILEIMKMAAEAYGLSAIEIAEEIIRIGLDKDVDPKVRFAFLKEANLRIFGVPQGSLEDTLQTMSKRVNKLFDLTVPALEATAQNDGIKMIKEIIRQGKLDDILHRIKKEEEGEIEPMEDNDDGSG